MSETARHILLVTGCPRSGTTALVRLLNTHPSVAIGMERYTRRLLDEHHLEADLFTPDRFATFVEGDCNRVSFDARATQAACAKAQTATVIGDKSPNPVEVFEAAEAMDGEVSVIMILRSPRAVARSFQVRAERAKTDPAAAQYWPASRDYKRGIKAFNRSVEATLEFANRLRGDADLSRRVRFKVVSYEDLFRNRDEADSLFAFLGIRSDDADGIAAIYEESAVLSGMRKAPLIDLAVALWAKRRDYARALDLAQMAA
ncbi:sulfotransferase family protein [Dinoroseobacter sp. S124A]|uniref:sulfotransferase family protein n=1 Tax=Dinoroseobacter sp. S124A TaxID=3415128 RepID=UPI003C7E4C07